MHIVKQGTVVAALVAALLAAVPATAGPPPELQAIAWIAGEAQISADSIRCQIPTVTDGFSDGSFQMGLWNTFGEPTLSFPNPNGAFANPCGGWLQMQNNLVNQGILVDRIKFQYKVLGARRFRQFVPTRNGFPIACRPYRKETRYVAARLNAANSGIDTPAGAPNVAMVHPIPIVTTQLFSCLRSQYAPLPSDVFTSLPLLIRTTVYGTTDLGETVTSNTINYTLTLRHLCGNGRQDDGEECDPAAPNSCFEQCSAGFCLLTGSPCVTALDCVGLCLPSNDPQECTCAF